MPVILPDKVKVDIDGREVKVEGPKGKLNWEIPKLTSARLEGNQIIIERKGENKEAKALHGLARSLLNNMVVGVSTGFVKELEIQGIGFKATMKGNVVDLSLGYSHPIRYEVPKGIKVNVSEGTRLKIEGADKQVVGKVAAEIRGFYPPEPYKGKGVRYKDERIIRKEGKTVQ